MTLQNGQCIWNSETCENTPCKVFIVGCRNKLAVQSNFIITVLLCVKASGKTLANGAILEVVTNFFESQAVGLSKIMAAY